MLCCTNCGKPINKTEKFCTGCGNQIVDKTITSSDLGVKKDTNPTQKKQEGKFTKEGRKIISSGPKPTQKYKAATPVPNQKLNKNKLLRYIEKIVLTILAIFIVIFVFTLIFPEDENTIGKSTIVKEDAIEIENNNKLYEKVLGSWSVVDVATGKIDNSGAGWNFVDDGTCYQDGEKNKNISDRRKWRINEYGNLEIDFVEQTISYKISFEGDKMFFERYKPYYYYVRK